MNPVIKARMFANTIATTVGNGNQGRVLAPSIFQPPASGAAYVSPAYHWMQVL